MRNWVFPLALAWLLALTDTPNFAAETAPASRIIEGTNVPASQFPTVAYIEWSDLRYTYSGSGTLIAPDYVLTAAHVLHGNDSQATAGDLKVTLAAGTFNVSEIHINPSWDPADVRFSEGTFDAALLKLTATVPDVTPTPIYREAPTVGASLTIAGYGLRGTGITGQVKGSNPDPGTIDFGTIVIDTLTPTHLKWTFDAGEANTASGDSGGPSFFETAGTTYLAGITRGGSGGTAFGSNSTNCRVDAMADWIDSVLNPGRPIPPVEVLSDLTASSNPATQETPVTFSFYLNKADLAWSWDFGDGQVSNQAGPLEHTYSINGTYAVTVTVTRKLTGQTISRSLLLSVSGFNGHSPGSLVDVFSFRHSFRLNFRTPASSTLNIVFERYAEFGFASRTELSKSVSAAKVRILIGENEIDSMTLLSNGAGAGKGALRWNYRAGQLSYRLKSAALIEALAPFGAANESQSGKVVEAPLFVEIEGVRFGGTYRFFFKAVAGKSGSGR